MIQISVYYIVKNEAARLPESLEQTQRFADEIVVVDSGSTDDTVAIAESFGARVSFHEWRGFAIQKAHAADLCTHDWVLEVDADETPSEALITQLQHWRQRMDLDAFAGFELPIRHVAPFPGHPMRYAPDVRVMRLYHRQRAAIPRVEHTIDDRARVLQGRVGRLTGPLMHRPVLSLAQIERKYAVLSSDQAAEYVQKARVIPAWRLYAEFPVKFFKYFVLRQGFRNGWYGFATSLLGAQRNVMRLAKARELALQSKADKT